MEEHGVVPDDEDVESHGFADGSVTVVRRAVEILVHIAEPAVRAELHDRVSAIW